MSSLQLCTLSHVFSAFYDGLAQCHLQTDCHSFGMYIQNNKNKHCEYLNNIKLYMLCTVLYCIKYCTTDGPLIAHILQITG